MMPTSAIVYIDKLHSLDESLWNVLVCICSLEHSINVRKRSSMSTHVPKFTGEC